MNTSNWDGPLPKRALWIAGNRFNSGEAPPLRRRRHAKLSMPEFLLLSAALLALLLL
ncbi:MAG: hypothetical protein AAB250_13380 [Bdellovibrionota bacterium]